MLVLQPGTRAGSGQGRVRVWLHANLGAFVMVGTLAALTVSVAAAYRDRWVPGTSPNRRQFEGREAILDLTVVVPFYNPGPMLADHLDRLIDVLKATDVSFEVIAVADGCTDGSEAVVERFDPELVKLVRLPRNFGKGEALRLGFCRGRGRYLGFIDADGDLDPELWRSFLAVMDLYKPDVVLGSKRHPLSEVHYPTLRRVLSVGYQLLVRLLFRLNVRDTQTGIKLVRREVLEAVLPQMVEQRFTFDLELFVVARHLGFRRFFEVPVRLNYQFRSTVSPRVVWRMLRDTVRIFLRLHLRGAYDSPRRTPGLVEAASLGERLAG